MRKSLILVTLLWGQVAEAQDLVIAPLPSDLVIGGAEVEEGVSTATPVALAPTRALPRRAGLPTPSIIVGDEAILATIGERGPLGMPFEAREAVRIRDLVTFERLLSRGAFDPDPARLAEAIQAELQRMECYGGALDGEWGGGSQTGVERWSEASGTTIAATPDIALFRALVRHGDLRCAAVQPAQPQPAAATAPRAATSGASPRAAQSTPRATQPASTQPTQAAPAESAPRINPSLMGSGMFR